MGNNSCSTTENLLENKCIICWDQITCDTWAMCVQCKILLHCECETTYRTINNRNYCLCPHCQRVGSLGTIYKGLNDNKIK